MSFWGVMCDEKWVEKSIVIQNLDRFSSYCTFYSLNFEKDVDPKFHEGRKMMTKPSPEWIPLIFYLKVGPVYYSEQ